MQINLTVFSKKLVISCTPRGWTGSFLFSDIIIINRLKLKALTVVLSLFEHIQNKRTKTFHFIWFLRCFNQWQQYKVVLCFNLPRCSFFCFVWVLLRCVFVCVPPQSSHLTNLPAQTVSSLRRRLSSLWFMSLIKPCVYVCVSQGHTVPYNHSTSSLSQPLPPPVADNSCGCGCECFRSVLVRLVSLSEGTVLTASLLI